MDIARKINEIENIVLPENIKFLTMPEMVETIRNSSQQLA